MGKKGVLTTELSEYRISEQKLRLSKDEAANYDRSTRSGGLIMAAWVRTWVTDTPEFL